MLASRIFQVRQAEFHRDDHRLEHLAKTLRRFALVPVRQIRMRSPAFEAGATAISAEVNGATVTAASEATPGDTHVTVRTGAVQKVEAIIRVKESAEPPMTLAAPLPGDPAPAHR